VTRSQLLLHVGLQGRRKLARAQRRGSEQRKPVAVGAIVSNHVGYTDVLVSTRSLSMQGAAAASHFVLSRSTPCTLQASCVIENAPSADA
jgi:hypothetical protein